MRKAFKRYQLSYPFEGKKIYESRSMARAAKRCYKEVIDAANRSDNIFSIIDLDDLIEYNFRINDRKFYAVDSNDNLISTQETVTETPNDKVVPIFKPIDKLDLTPTLK